MILTGYDWTDLNYVEKNRWRMEIKNSWQRSKFATLTEWRKMKPRARHFFLPRAVFVKRFAWTSNDIIASVFSCFVIYANPGNRGYPRDGVRCSSLTRILQNCYIVIEVRVHSMKPISYSIIFTSLGIVA